MRRPPPTRAPAAAVRTPAPTAAPRAVAPVVSVAPTAGSGEGESEITTGPAPTPIPALLRTLSNTGSAGEPSSSGQPAANEVPTQEQSPLGLSNAAGDGEAQRDRRTSNAGLELSGAMVVTLAVMAALGLPGLALAGMYMRMRRL